MSKIKEKFKSLPYWFKGIIIVFILYVLVLFIMVFVGVAQYDTSLSSILLTPLAFVVMFSSLKTPLLLVLLAGAFLGWVYGKIKRRHEP